MALRFYGQQRDKILSHLVSKWLPYGPPVTILQGFPGCGKSQLARDLADSASRSIDPVEPQTDSTDPVVDLYLDLAVALEAHGLPDLVQEVDKGNKAKLDKALLEILRHKQILIIIDEFQRLLPKDKSTPPSALAKLIEDLNNSPHSQGRLLLISNRLIKIERWSENCQVEEIKGLPDEEAEALFTDLLESKGLGEAVPLERRREIVHRLGGNPRALKTLIVGLRTEALDDLLSAAPDLLKPGDVVLDPGLVEDFEREVLERALPRLEADLLKFMRWLSVHRRPFKKEALAQFTAGRNTPEALRKQLFDRFLLERVAGGDVPHPLAREISVTRLRTEGREWVQAHNLAANYYFRYFKARQQTGASNLGASYIELRHHLNEAGRIGELYEATEKFTQYAISRIGLTTPVPTNKEALEERIALLSALPDTQRPKVLEYHLALCLLKRGMVGDKKLALEHARRGTGRHPSAAPWILQINLEYELHGIDSALPIVRRALRNIKADEDSAPIYTQGAGLMTRAGRLDDAIALLEKGIAVIPPDKSLSLLYQTCAELMTRAGRLDDAIALLEKGISIVPADRGLILLYQTAIVITARRGDFHKAETLAIEGLAATPKDRGSYKILEALLRVFTDKCDTEAIQRLLNWTGSQQADPPQRALANYYLASLSGDWVKAADVAHKGSTEFPDYVPLRIRESDARLALGQVHEADALMRGYQPGTHSVSGIPSVWFKAYICLIAGRINEAKAIAAMYAPEEFSADRPLDEAEMLRLWTVHTSDLNSSVERIFPGLAEYRQRIAAQPQTGEDMLAVQLSGQMCLLVVADEWDSRHGGLSSFNRELCSALASTGTRVVCYLLEASAEEKRRAREVNVEIVEAKKIPGIKDRALLVNPPELPSGFVPDVIIGHDRITGAASTALAQYHYPSSKRVLFIHTSPEEIEWHKEPRGDSTSAERAKERKREQLDLAEGCDLVVTVGPRLTREFGTDLLGAGNQVPIMELTPGLPGCPRNAAATLPFSIRCLILGRVEDYQLKGLDLAAKAFGRVVANWRQANPPKFIVRGAPVGTDDALRSRLTEDSAPTEIDIVIRHYSADETEIRNDLREASLVLMPSKKEGFGLVGLESIACGVPTLISALSGLAETVSRYAPELAPEWILPVSGDAVTEWTGRIKLLLEARESAFARATVLRERLSVGLDWKRAAAELLERLTVARALT
jgi:glycosyltransferase involved in cell wall biosynthesis/tetratricopeptide (TPR) repeat protein